MSKLSREDVLALARLCRLDLSEPEIEGFAGELSEILGYVETLNQVDTADLEPTYQVTGLKNRMRGDKEIDYQAKPESLLAGAPSTQDTQFKVKRVLE